ncbi:MAG: hypothetical protein QXY70_00445 [Nanopusillaceae archaeon]
MNKQEAKKVLGVVKEKVEKQAAYSSSPIPSFWYSPELTTESWLLPKSRQEVLKWIRIFFNLEPFVQTAIIAHSQFPFSKFDIVTEDESITDFYREVCFNEEFDLYEFLLQAALSFEKFGEFIAFGNLVRGSDGLYRWKKFILLEPELVEIKSDLFSGELVFELIPPADLKKMINSMSEEELMQSKIPPIVIKSVKEGKNIPLDPFCTSIVARKTDPSAIRGTSRIQACFKTLIFQDWLRLGQIAYYQRFIFPIEQWIIGDLNKDILPSSDDLENWKRFILNQMQSPPYTIITPPIVRYEVHSAVGKLLPVLQEYNYIHDQLLAGLSVTKEFLTGGGINITNPKTMVYQRLITYYKNVRDLFENWMINKFFRPLAKLNNFRNKNNKLILPEIVWYKSLDIEAAEQEKKDYMELHRRGYISTKTLFSKFQNLDIEKEKVLLEAERGTIFDKENRLVKPKHETTLNEEKLLKPVSPLKEKESGLSEKIELFEE